MPPRSRAVRRPAAAGGDGGTGAASRAAPRARQGVEPREAREALRQAILGGEYLPGERLVEASLCERLGASRFTVRAVLQELAAEGLVEVQRNKGAQVRKVSIEEAVEITEIRMVVEGLVAGRAATLASDDECRELDEIGLLMRRAVDAGEFRRYSELNKLLHATVRRIARHKTADTIIETMRGQLVRHQFALSLLPGRPAVSLPQHLRIIEAIKAGDAAAAESAMREHIASVIEALRGLDGVGLV